MLQELYDKIDAKKIFVQSKTSNLIKQVLFKITLKALKMLSKKELYNLDL